MQSDLETALNNPSLYSTCEMECFGFSTLEVPGVGFVTYKHDEKNREMLIKRLYVAEDQRRRGKGTLLFDYVENLARQLGCVILGIQFNTHQKYPQPGLRFLMALGLEIVNSEAGSMTFAKLLNQTHLPT